MPGCVLHIEGESFDVDSFLEGSSIRPLRIWHKGEQMPKRGKHPQRN